MFGINEKIFITLFGFALAGLASPFSIIPPYSELE